MRDRASRHPILDLAASPEVRARFRAAAAERLADARHSGIPIAYWHCGRGEIVYDYGDGRIVPVCPDGTDEEGRG